MNSIYLFNRFFGAKHPNPNKGTIVFMAAVFYCNVIEYQVKLLILFDAKQHEVTLSWIQHHIVVIKPIR